MREYTVVLQVQPGGYGEFETRVVHVKACCSEHALVDARAEVEAEDGDLQVTDEVAVFAGFIKALPYKPPCKRR